MSEIIRVRNRKELAQALERTTKDAHVDIRGPGFHVKIQPVSEATK